MGRDLTRNCYTTDFSKRTLEWTNEMHFPLRGSNEMHFPLNKLVCRVDNNFVHPYYSYNSTTFQSRPLSKLMTCIFINKLMRCIFINPWYCLIWHMAAKTHLQKLLVLQKWVLCMMYFPERRAHAVALFISSKILPLQMLYFETVSSIMFAHLLHECSV